MALLSPRMQFLKFPLVKPNVTTNDFKQNPSTLPYRTKCGIKEDCHQPGNATKGSSHLCVFHNRSQESRGWKGMLVILEGVQLKYQVSAQNFWMNVNIDLNFEQHVVQ